MANPDFEHRLRASLDDLCRGIIADHTGPVERLWQTLERQVTAVLRTAQRQRSITSFHVRCDRETNEGIRQGAVVEILYQLPQRVETLELRFNQR